MHELAQAGATAAASARDLLGGDALIAMLPNDDALRGLHRRPAARADKGDARVPTPPPPD